MPYFDFEEEISPREFIRECDEDDLQELIKELERKGRRLSHSVTDTLLGRNSISVPESEYESALDKLTGKWNRLSKEDEQAILAIASKF